MCVREGGRWNTSLAVPPLWALPYCQAAPWEGRGSGHQSARLGMCPNSYGNHTEKQHPPLQPGPSLSRPFSLGWDTHLVWLPLQQPAVCTCVRVCVLQGTSSENTPPLPLSCCLPPTLTSTAYSSVLIRGFGHVSCPLPWLQWSWGRVALGKRGVCGVCWGALSEVWGSVRTRGLPRKRAQAFSSPRALCLVGRLAGKPQAGAGMVWSLGASPVESGGGGGEMSLGAGAGEGVWSWGRRCVCVWGGRLRSQGVCGQGGGGCDRCGCTGRDWDIVLPGNLDRVGPGS